jgi:AraC-like DNA-binding protein
MELFTKSYNLMNFIKRLATSLGATLQDGCQECFFDLPEKAGTGTIRAFDFEDGLQAMLVEVNALHDWEWIFKPPKASPFLMHFLVRGQVSIDFDEDHQDIRLKPLFTVFASNPPGEGQVIRIRGGDNLLYFMLQIDREVYIDHVDCFSTPVTKELSNIFNGKTVTKTFQNHQDYGLQGSALIHEILSDEQSGLPRATFVEAKVLELFALQLRRWEEEINEPEIKINLQTGDIEQLTEARKLILDNLENALTIEELAKRVGLNRQKLKMGFKKVHGKTINEFMRNERLKLARQLLASGRPIVKEVAAKVGYENASYFARRFREKYGLYPNEYLKALYSFEEE